MTILYKKFYRKMFSIGGGISNNPSFAVIIPKQIFYQAGLDKKKHVVIRYDDEEQIILMKPCTEDRK